LHIPEEVINVFQVVVGSVSIMGKKHGIGVSLRIISKLMKREL
jgi:hypothetical protein